MHFNVKEKENIQKINIWKENIKESWMNIHMDAREKRIWELSRKK